MGRLFFAEAIEKSNGNGKSRRSDDNGNRFGKNLNSLLRVVVGVVVWAGSSQMFTRKDFLWVSLS